MIKKLFKNTLCTLAIIATFLTIGIAGRLEATYSMHGTVIDETTVEDDRGHIWGYDNELKKGSDVTITFDNNNTVNIIYDDIVVDVK